MNVCYVPQRDRYRTDAKLERDCPEVLQGLEVARRPHHKFAFGHGQHRAAGFLIGLADGLSDFSLSNAQRGHFQGIELHLILLDHPAHGRHFRHIGQGFEFELEKPVLQGAQLCEVMLATAVHQRVLINPAHPRGIRAQRRFGAGGQAALNLAQVLQHPRARPIQVGAVFKQHIDKAVAKK